MSTLDMKVTKPLKRKGYICFEYCIFTYFTDILKISAIIHQIIDKTNGQWTPLYKYKNCYNWFEVLLTVTQRCHTMILATFSNCSLTLLPLSLFTGVESFVSFSLTGRTQLTNTIEKKYSFDL